MKNVFRDPQLEEEFLSKGFVTLPLFTTEEIAELRQFYYNYSAPMADSIGKRNNTYELSFFDNDSDRKKFIFEKLTEMLKEKWEQYLDDYEPIVLNMFSKEKGKGEVPVHQNWTFVDETKFRSVSLWIPLQDVSHANGTLEVVPGTHDNFHLFRGPNVPWIFENITTQIKDKYMQPLNLSVGEAAVIDDSVLHYSSENKTDEPRIAIQAILKPKAATAQVYFLNDAKNGLNVFEATPDYFMSIDVTQAPVHLRKIQSIPYTHQPITENDLLKFIERHEESIQQ